MQSVSPPEAHAAEQPTLPLPIPGTEKLPGGGNWLMSEHSVLLIPGTILAAVGGGELLRSYVLLTDDARSNFAILGMVCLYGLVHLAFLIPRTISRGKDGRS